MTSGGTRWDIVALALASGYVIGMQVGKVPPVLPLLQAEFDLSRVLAGLIASSFYGMGAVFGVVGGLLIDRVGVRRTILAGCVVMFAAGLCGGLAGSGTFLLVTRLVEGFGFVALTVAAPKLIIAATGTDMRRFTLGAWGTYMPIGMALSLVLATVLLEGIGWRGLWFLNCGLVLLFFLAFVRMTAPHRWQESAVPGSLFDSVAVRATLARPGPWLFGACFVLFSIQWLAVMAWLPTFLIETQGRSTSGSALVTAVIVTFTALGSIAAALLMHHGAARGLLIAIAYVAMGLCAALLFAPLTSESAKVPLAICFALLGGLLPAACLEGGAAHAPGRGQIAMASGFVAQGAALGSVIGPPLLAVAMDTVGDWTSAWWIMLICPGFGLCIAIAVLRADDQLATLQGTKKAVRR